MISRKTKRQTAWLLYLFLVHASPLYAEEFDPIIPTQALATEVPLSSATSSQYRSLQNQAAEALASRADFQEFLEQHFTFPGVHGELRGGEIIDDWDGLGATAGVSGALLMAAYGLWRVRKRKFLEALKTGDSQALDSFFGQNFSLEGLSGEMLSGEIITDWQHFADQQGLFGGGATLAALYALWKKRKQREMGILGEGEDISRIIFEIESEKTFQKQFHQEVTEADIRREQEQKSQFFRQIKNVFHFFSLEEVGDLVGGFLKSKITQEPLSQQEFSGFLQEELEDVRDEEDSFLSKFNDIYFEKIDRTENQKMINFFLKSAKNSYRWVGELWKTHEKWTQESVDEALQKYKNSPGYHRMALKQLWEREQTDRRIEGLIEQQKENVTQAEKFLQDRFLRGAFDQDLSAVLLQIGTIRDRRIKKLTELSKQTLSDFKVRAYQKAERNYQNNKRNVRGFYWQQVRAAAYGQAEESIRVQSNAIPEYYEVQREATRAMFARLEAEISKRHQEIIFQRTKQQHLEDFSRRVDYIADPELQVDADQRKELYRQQQEVPVKKRVLGFLKNLVPASFQGVHFQAVLANVQNVHLYEEELEALRTQRSTSGNLWSRIQILKEKRNKPNDYSKKEIMDRNPYLRNARWTAWEEWNNNKKNLGRSGDLYWNRQYTKYKFSLAKFRQTYDPEKERLLKELAEKARSETWRSYDGWQKYYKVHPLEFGRQKNILDYQIQHLEQIEEKRKAMLDTRIEDLESLREQNLEPLWATKNWFEQTSQERFGNPLTEQIIQEENLGRENPALEKIEVLLAHQKAEEAHKEAQQQILDLIERYEPEVWSAEKAVAQAVRTMKHYSSPAGIRRRHQVYGRPGDGGSGNSRIQEQGVSTLRRADGSTFTYRVGTRPEGFPVIKTPPETDPVSGSSESIPTEPSPVISDPFTPPPPLEEQTTDRSSATNAWRDQLVRIDETSVEQAFFVFPWVLAPSAPLIETTLRGKRVVVRKTPWIDNWSVAPVEGKTVTIFLKLPNPNSEDFLDKIGVTGHAGIALEDEFYDFGPGVDEISITDAKNGVQGDQWWDDDPDIAQKDGDADLEEVLHYVENTKDFENPVYKVTLSVTDEQFNTMKDYWEEVYNNLGQYTLLERQCTTTVGDSLEKAGIINTPQNKRLSPKELFQVLKKNLRNTAGIGFQKKAQIIQIR